MRVTVLAAAILVAPPALAAQGTAYVPLDHWAMPWVEHLIARGAVLDPTPLTRPLRRGELRAALEAADTSALPAGLRRVVRDLVAELAGPDRGAWGRLDAHAGVAAATHARRDPLREAGPGHATFAGGLAFQGQFGPVVVATHPYFDTRLKWDPDYRGKQDRAIAGRNAEAYISAQWKYAELFFGTLDRNWGWPAVESLLLSPAPYGYDHLMLAVGTASVRFEGVVTELDDLPDATGEPNHRYWVAHRLVVRPSRATSVALWEGTLLAGPGRTLEPWFANIVNLGLLAQYDQGTDANNLLGLDLATRVGRTALHGSLLIDDIQVDDRTPGDAEPASYGFTLGAQGRLGPATWTAFYTQVSNLAYRTPNPVETVMRRDVGLARNFSDYDQLTLRAAVVAGPGVLLTPEVTLLRQGEGDFRLPYPAVADYPSTPAFLAGTPERTVRLAADVRLDRRRWSIAANGGVHLVSDAGHVRGEGRSEFVGSVGATYRLRIARELP